MQVNEYALICIAIKDKTVDTKRRPFIGVASTYVHIDICCCFYEVESFVP